MPRPKIKPKKKKQYKLFYIYISGKYEEVFFKKLNSLLAQNSIKIISSRYNGGADFKTGLEYFKKQLKCPDCHITNNLENADTILIQGDMDTGLTPQDLKELEKNAQKLDKRSMIIPSHISFESWISAIFCHNYKDNLVYKKEDLDHTISDYSKKVDNAKKYFTQHLSLDNLQQGATKNKSLQKLLTVLQNP